jgi:hypothetical protein
LKLLRGADEHLLHLANQDNFDLHSLLFWQASVSITNLSLLSLDYKFNVDCPNDDPLAELKMKPEQGLLEPGTIKSPIILTRLFF